MLKTFDVSFGGTSEENVSTLNNADDDFDKVSNDRDMRSDREGDWVDWEEATYLFRCSGQVQTCPAAEH